MPINVATAHGNLVTGHREGTATAHTKCLTTVYPEGRVTGHREGTATAHAEGLATTHQET